MLTHGTLSLNSSDVRKRLGVPLIFGDGSVDSNVMMTVATSESFQGPFRLLFPRFDDVLNPPPPGILPFSLLGLGDVAVPGLLACLAVGVV